MSQTETGAQNANSAVIEPVGVSTKPAIYVRKLPEPLAANLWKPGQSGNPKGRGRPTPLTAALLKQLQKKLPGADDQTIADALAARLIKLALKENAKSLEALLAIFDRVEGKPFQRTELTGEGGGPVTFETPASRAEVVARIQAVLSGVTIEATQVAVPVVIGKEEGESLGPPPKF
jgi:hypothetical protein